ncbi:hypothetical protein RFI_28355, partial [Reticulomyxa filosa]
MRNQTTPFQTLKELLTPLKESQYVLHKHELLICGGQFKRACYSYHTLKNEYNHVKLWGNSVVKLVDNNQDKNQITLLSFGGKNNHTLVMKYVSIWSNGNDENEMNKSKELNKLNNYNEWVPFTDNHSHPIIIGRDYDDYLGVRAVIGGST